MKTLTQRTETVNARELFYMPVRSADFLEWGSDAADRPLYDIQIPRRHDGNSDRICLHDSRDRKLLLTGSELKNNPERFDAVLLQGPLIDDFIRRSPGRLEQIGVHTEGYICYHRQLRTVEEMFTDDPFLRAYVAYGITRLAIIKTQHHIRSLLPTTLHR